MQPHFDNLSLNINSFHWPIQGGIFDLNSHFVFSNFLLCIERYYTYIMLKLKNDPKMCFQYLSLWVTGSNSKYFITFESLWDFTARVTTHLKNCANLESGRAMHCKIWFLTTRLVFLHIIKNNHLMSKSITNIYFSCKDADIS